MSFIPPVSYLTYLDIYVIIAYMFLAVSILENFVAAWYARAWAVDDGWALRPGYDWDNSWALQGDGAGGDDPDARADMVEKGDWIFAPVYLGTWTLFHLVILLGVALGWFHTPWAQVENPPDDEASQTVHWHVT